MIFLKKKKKKKHWNFINLSPLPLFISISSSARKHDKFATYFVQNFWSVRGSWESKVKVFIDNK